MATILVLNGSNKGEWYTVGERPMVFGRDDSILAELRDPCVSHRHLEVRLDSDEHRYYAVDTSSRNGVDVNGQRIKGFKALSDQDLIRIGHTLLVFRLEEVKDDHIAQALVRQYQLTHRETIKKLDEAHRERMGKALQSTMGYEP